VKLSQKTYYALRAVLELAKRPAQEPISIATIAGNQQIPPQFLQVIMRELRQGGFVTSRRGKDGGYLLAARPSQVAVGAVVRFLEGDFTPVDGAEDPGALDFPAFNQLWQDARTALDGVFDSTSFADLVERERVAAAAADYVI